MESSMKEVSNQELIELYKLIVSHQEYLNTELEKVGEDKND